MKMIFSGIMAVGKSIDENQDTNTNDIKIV